MAPTHGSTIKAANATLLVSGQLDAVADFFAPTYVVHVTDRDIEGGPAFVRQFLGMLHGAFSDLEVDVEILVEFGDRVAWQRTIGGTQTGSFAGFPPTRRRIVWRDMVTSRFEGGLIAEDWAVTDLAERLLLARKG